jgi:acylphosphatase
VTIARRLLISGRVQGVCYRDWTVEAAGALGLAGWVRNMHDGRVEAFVEGGADAVAAMIARCHEGPAHARVDAVEACEAIPEGGRGFTRR